MYRGFYPFGAGRDRPGTGSNLSDRATTSRKIAKRLPRPVSSPEPPRLAKSDFANIDARVRCPTEDCWGDLLLFPTGVEDEQGMPVFQPFTACPLCGRSFEIAQDLTDRELFLKIAWLRANPDAEPGDG